MANAEGCAVGTVIGFATKPVLGYVQGPDFQILPMPEGATLPPVEYADHPFRLEFTFQRSENPIEASHRRSATVSGIVPALNLFLHTDIRWQSHSADHAWVQREDADGVWTSFWEQLGYYYQDVWDKDHFTDITWEPLERVPHAQFFAEMEGITGEGLKISDSFDELFHRYARLPEGNYEKFVRSLVWLSASSRIWPESQSASYVALVSAIESVLPEVDEDRCECCRQPQYHLTQRFREFLADYAPPTNEEMRRAEDRLARSHYYLRSDLTHGLKLLRSDLEPWQFSDRQWVEERSKQKHLAQTVRLALVTWLMTQVRD